MDWLRRNWPDMLIGVALIAVIAGIVATLLTGGSFFPLGGGGSPSTGTTPPPAVSTPSAQPDDAGGPASAPDASAAAPDAGGEPGGASPDASAADGPSVAVLPPSGEADEVAPPGAPASDVGAAEEADAPSVTPVAPSDGAADAAQAGDAQAAAATTGPAPASSDAASTSAAAGEAPTAPFRVSVGAFGLLENAEAQAARFRDAGYPVFLGAQGDLTLVLVGPYDDEPVARRVADEIRAGDYGVDPVIYEFQPDDGAAASSAPASTAEPAAAPAPTPEPTPATSTASSAAPAAEASGTTLQVGAYGDRSSAEPQIERLEALGFAVRTIDEGGLVKVLVGPFTGAALSDARTVLDGARLEYFAR